MIKDLKNVLLQVSNDDQHAFCKLFETYSGKVHGFALKLTHSSTLAEEIVQDIFLKIWTNRTSLTSIDFFPAYLHTITRNHCFNVLKRLALEETTKAKIATTLKHESYETEETIIFEECQQLLDNAIEQLPPRQRLVYSLCHQEGLKYDEVAQRLNISRLTVKTQMQLALRTIKAHFGSALGATLLFFPLI